MAINKAVQQIVKNIHNQICVDLKENKSDFIRKYVIQPSIKIKICCKLYLVSWITEDKPLNNLSF